MSKGLVSIIVPVYNRAEFLADCLSSIREQSWEALDVIVVDDGSTDGSRELVQDYVRHDARFRLLPIAHQGVSAARNKGIEAARGEFLTFVDADDTIEREYIRKLAEGIGEADFCISGYKVWYQERNVWQSVKPPAGRFTLAEFGKAIPRYEAVLRGVGWKLLRRSAVATRGLRFSPQLRYAEDTVFFFQYLTGVETIAVLREAQYVYRQHSRQSLVKASHQDLSLIGQFSAALETLYAQTQGGLRELIAYWQVLNLWEYGRVACYRTKGFLRRRRQFFELARRDDIRRKCGAVRHGSLPARAVKLTVLSHAFLPLNLFVRAAGRIKHWDKQFV